MISSPDMDALNARLGRPECRVPTAISPPPALEFLARLAIHPGTQMLDVACGAGRIPISAARLVRELRR